MTFRGHVMIKIGHVAYVSMRLDETDLVIPFPRLNPRPYRGGGVQPPPLRFFADSKNTVARSAAGFWATLWGKPCAIFGKKNLTGSGQVTEL